MISETEAHETLVELFAVANAPLTPSQRVQRAKPVLEATGMTAKEIVATIRNDALRWNEERAKILGVSAETWQEALTAGGIDDVADLAGLLDSMHKAEAASAMLRAGYKPGKDAAGKLAWNR